MSKMPLSELKALLDSERNDALAATRASKLSVERSDAMDYYLGDMAKDMPASDGRSRAVSTDVADTIEGLMPSLMEIFCGGDEVVRFEPVGPRKKPLPVGSGSDRSSGMVSVHIPGWSQ